MATPSSAPVLDVQCLAGTMYAGCRDGRARAWLADQDKPICTYIAHNAPIQALLLDEEARMYTGSDDNSIRVWDLKVCPFLQEIAGVESDSLFAGAEARRGHGELRIRVRGAHRRGALSRQRRESALLWRL